MKTYLFHGVRIPEGWKIREGRPIHDSRGHCDPRHKEIVLNPIINKQFHTIAHESYHARIHAKGGRFAFDEHFDEKDREFVDSFHEYHETRAFLYQIHCSLKRNDLEGLKYVNEALPMWSKCNDSLGRASKRIINSNIWKRVQKALKESASVSGAVGGIGYEG